MDWEQAFTKIGAFWYHDGNPKRPYARLTSGLISNGFFDGGKVAIHARLFGEACDELANAASIKPLDFAHGQPAPLPYVIGAAMGAIPLTLRLAEAAGFRFAYAEKDGEEKLVFNRFTFEPRERFVLCEDVVTTGGTLKKLKRAAAAKSKGCSFNVKILALCNRSESAHLNDAEDHLLTQHHIVSLIHRPMKTWEEGKNPFTADGRELVEPVKPKAHWAALTSSYE